MNTKKIIYLGFVSLLLTFTACNNLIETPPTPSLKLNAENYTYYESFRDGIGNFKAFSVIGEQTWTASANYRYAIMNGSINNAPVENEDWLISPAINLPPEVTSVMTFDYVLRGFSNVANEASIWVTDDYNVDSSPLVAKWTQLTTLEPMVNAADWNLMNAGDISLKAFKGKKVNVAFKYNSTAAIAGVWQIRNIIVKDRVPVTLPYTETFAETKGRFTAINVAGSQNWYIDTHGYAYISGFVNTVNNANEDWLISPQIDLTKVTEAKLSFDYVTRYFGNIKTDATVWISEDYEEGLPAKATWTQLITYPFSDNGNWNLTTSHELSLSKYAGKKISVGFKYIATSAKAGTWELKNFKVQEGAPSDIYFIEPFASGLGGFTTNNVLGAQTWYFYNGTSTYAVMSGFANSVSNANEDWLISPSINLTGKTSAKLSFDYTINKGLVANMQTNHTLWLSADNGATWEQIAIPVYPAGNNWTFVNSGNIVLPAKFLGISTFKFAFKYLCSTAESASWEIKKLIIVP